MAEVTWGSLAKTIDNKITVSEEIDADILEHNEDPSAHSQNNEALDVHKKADPLDHPDGSVTNAKIDTVAGSKVSGNITGEATATETKLTTHKTAATLDHPDSSVKTAKIATGAVTPVKVADSYVKYYEIEVTANQSIIGDMAWADVTALVQSFTADKGGTLIAILYAYFYLSGSDANAAWRFKITKNGVTTYYPSTSGFELPKWKAGDVVAVSAFTLPIITNFVTGVNTIQVQAARTSPDETFTIRGVTAGERARLSIVLLGAVIT